MYLYRYAWSIGQLICFNKQCKAGEGTYELGDSIYASILGLVHTEKIPGEEVILNLD